jgi:type III secretion system chaperone SycN
MSFSAPVSRTIEAFAAQLGLPTSPAADGSHTFVFNRSGSLTFTAAEPRRVVISLSRRIDVMNETVERRILSLAGPDVNGRHFVHAGTTRDGSAVFAISLDEGRVDLPAIEVCLQQLLAAQSALP